MKRFISLLFALILTSCGASYADEDIDYPTNDLWDNWTTTNYDKEVVPVSDEDFNNAVEQLDKKINKKKYKQKKKIIPKGEEFSQSNETEKINEQVNKDILPVVCLPVEIIVGDAVLPVGHYQIKGEKDENGNVFLKFYQSHYMMAQFTANETDDDFGADTIIFAMWEPAGDNKIKLMYGSVDFNAYTFIQIKE